MSEDPTVGKRRAQSACSARAGASPTSRVSLVLATSWCHSEVLGRQQAVQGQGATGSGTSQTSTVTSRVCKTR